MGLEKKKKEPKTIKIKCLKECIYVNCKEMYIDEEKIVILNNEIKNLIKQQYVVEMKENEL